VKPAPFDYARPRSLDEALELLSRPGAKVLAGGQSLVPLLSMRLAAPELLVDINGLGDLAYVEADGSAPEAGVRVGALARHSDVLAHEGARAVQPLLGRALRLVAHATIRNRGTTVGSIVHADAAAEVPAVLALLGGGVTAASRSGRRYVAAADLFVGPLESSLRSDELAVEAVFPSLAPGAGAAIEEVSRRHGDYALCGVAVLVEPGAEDREPPLVTGRAAPHGALGSVRAGYFSVCDIPTVVDLTPALGSGLTETAFEDAADLALASLDPQEDIHATAAYRAQLVRALTRKAVLAAHADASERGRTLTAS
jgi:CO/xanthine dehydrogenase FAD-binding subunit